MFNVQLRDYVHMGVVVAAGRFFAHKNVFSKGIHRHTGLRVGMLGYEHADKTFAENLHIALQVIVSYYPSFR